MARRSQCSNAGDNPLDPNYLPPHYREEYRLAIDALVEEDLEGYYRFLQKADVVDFLSTPEIQHIQSSIHVPQQGAHPEHNFLEIGADGSSDTYWPLHSDLDAPGLDLGWPQMHHFMGPTEVTTLVNPPEPDMPSIKDQARRLIKNAQQVIAIAMDMFTDVDMFADVLNAAMRNVAVYIILDELNAHHFIDMVANCRVNLQSLQFLRVRTVPGITYQCCTGKSFKGQMMDRFLLTDCRAVLSGNYSFMWSYEKLHRCMAHLFLGQLVTTFDEEFRILYAQSQPLIINSMTGGPMEDLSHSQKRQYPTDRLLMYREQKPYLDPGRPEPWARHPHDERAEGDWRMMPLKKQDHVRGPADIYNRFPSQQSRMDPSMENPALKRHPYAEGISGRYSYPFRQQQGIPEPEPQGRQFQRGQQPYSGPGHEADYSGYEKFWNQDYLSTEPYPEPGLPQEMEPAEGFDPVLNYLSSTGAKDFDEGSERSHPAGELPFSSLHPRRLSLGQPYACQTSPTPSNTADQKQFFQEPAADRKDPAVKRGLRNWRISSYLSAYDNSGDEGLPMVPPQGADPFEEPSIPTQQTAPGIDFSLPKIPNVREFKVPAVPRASQLPSYAKVMTRDPPKKQVEEPVAVVAEPNTTPTPSESSSTTEGEKLDEVELKEPKSSVLRREESFRRKYNAAQPRSSRLRSSLIFTSLDQQNTSQETKSTSQDQQDEESDKNETEQTKLPFLSHLLGQRRSSAREPVEWSRFIKSATFDNSSTEEVKTGDSDSKAEDKDNTNPIKGENSSDLSENPKTDGPSKLSNIMETNVSSSEQPTPAHPPKSLLYPPLDIDMSDPDNRLMFFKELAAKRKAAEAEKSKEKPPAKQPTDPTSKTTVKKEEPAPKESTENLVSTSEVSLEKKSVADTSEETASTDAVQSVPLSLDATDQKNKQDSLLKNESNTSQSSKAEETKVPADSPEMEKQQSAVSQPEKETHQSSSLEQTNLSESAAKESKPCHPPITINTTANVSSPAQDTVESESPSLDSTSKECNSASPSSVEGSESSAVESNPKNPESVQSTTNISPLPLPSEQNTESNTSSFDPSAQYSSSDQTAPAPSSTEETVSSNTTPKDSSSVPDSNVTLSKSGKTKTQESVCPSLQESPQSAKETSLKSEKQMIPTNPDCSSQTTSSETSPVPESSSEPNTSSQSTTMEKPEDVSGATNAAQEAQKDDLAKEKDVAESQKLKLQSEMDISTPEKDNSDSCKNTSETENVVSMTEKIVSDSNKNISQSKKSISESEEVSDSGKVICDSEKDVSESENNLSQSGNISSATDEVSGSEKISSDSAKDLSESANNVSGSKDVSNSGEASCDLEKDVAGSEPSPFPKSVPDDSPTLGSTTNIKSDHLFPTPNPSMSDSSLVTVKSSATKPDLKETSTPAPTPSDTLPEQLPPETSSSVKTDLSSNVSQSETSTPPQDEPAQAMPPSNLNVKEVNEPNPTEMPPSSESVGSVLSPEAKVTETYMCALQSVPDTNFLISESPTESNKTPKQPSIKSPSSPTEPPASDVPKEINPPCKTTKSGTTESQTSEQTVPAENGKTEPALVETDKEKSDDSKDTKKLHDGTTQESVSSEKTNDQVKQINHTEPAEIPSKQTKSNQSRYHSSTANVLSSSNLRDDTKLLLGQISANSQTRNETAKEPPVTDDEKEDEADKNAKREQEKGLRILGKGQPTPTPEREKLLEKIQCMRKERKVYSRFEV